MLAAVAVLAFLHNLSLGAWTAIAWPSLLLITGLLLLLLIYPRHPLSDWPAIWRDPQQRQHTIIAGAVAAAGAAELLQSRSSAWAYVWPAALLIVGILFLTHAQHGTGAAVERAVWKHRWLGATLMGAGLLRFIEIIGGVVLWWPLILLAAAVQLVLYREPAGAFEGERHIPNEHTRNP